MLEAEAFVETVRAKLPEGFLLDEWPESASFEADFGAYSATSETKDGFFVFTRKLTLRNVSVAAERYADVRNFFSRISAIEQMPVVLIKK